ncbi:Pkinase-domain-containing protein [Trametes cingulata]|nr:Pkinase-domain-containing protein [Trametes cingulata]
MPSRNIVPSPVISARRLHRVEEAPKAIAATRNASGRQQPPSSLSSNSAALSNASSSAQTPSATPANEIGDPFAEIGENGEDISALAVSNNKVITGLTAYLTTIANDSTLRQSRAWKRFVRVRTDDLQSVRVERAIKRVRSDLAAHVNPGSSSEMNHSISQVVLDGESGSEAVTGESSVVREDIKEEGDGDQDGAGDEETAEGPEDRAPTPVSPTPAPISAEELKSAVSQSTVSNGDVTEDEEKGPDTPVQADGPTTHSRIVRSQSADPMARASRIYSSTPSQASQTGDDSSISTTGQRSARNSYEVDWWSFGTMLYEMLTGITPFWAENHSDMYYRVLQDELQFPEDRTMDQDTKSLIRGLLQRNPALRKEPRIKKHPYFSMIHERAATTVSSAEAAAAPAATRTAEDANVKTAPKLAGPAAKRAAHSPALRDPPSKRIRTQSPRSSPPSSPTPISYEEWQDRIDAHADALQAEQDAWSLLADIGAEYQARLHALEVAREARRAKDPFDDEDTYLDAELKEIRDRVHNDFARAQRSATPASQRSPYLDATGRADLAVVRALVEKMPSESPQPGRLEATARSPSSTPPVPDLTFTSADSSTSMLDIRSEESGPQRQTSVWSSTREKCTKIEQRVDIDLTVEDDSTEAISAAVRAS